MILMMIIVAGIAIAVGLGVGWKFGYSNGRADERPIAYELARAASQQELHRRARTESGDNYTSLADLLAKATVKRDAALDACRHACNATPLNELDIHRCEANLKLAQQQLDKVTYWAIGGGTP